MPDYRSYDRDPRRDYGERPIRNDSGVAGPRPGISRSSAPRSGAQRSGARPSGARPAPRPQQGSRPPQSRRSAPQGRRPAPRRRRRGVQPRFFVILAILIVLIVAVVFALTRGGGDKAVVPQPTPTVAPETGGMTNATVVSPAQDPAAQPAGADASFDGAALDMAQEEETDNAPQISTADQVQVSPEQLSVNTSLPSEWMNVLLLGTDERMLNEPARTDTMIIASINTNTGEVKLTSLMRDTAVEFTDVGEYSGTYRLNVANYFGGPLYAIKIINECLDLNIQYYVSVNFYGFSKIAQALGGIDVDITEAEMNEINSKQVYQYYAAKAAGIDESDQENVELTTYGPNTHLNGRQTLAYARVRYVDNDFSRAERQRKVIIKLTEKLRGKSITEILALLGSLSQNVTTNMDLNTVGQIAYTVLSSGLTNIETLRIPEQGSYKQERRHDQEMFYDTDWAHNSMLLYNFIYE